MIRSLPLDAAIDAEDSIAVSDRSRSHLADLRYLGCRQSLEEPVNDCAGCLFAPKFLDFR